MMRWLSGIAAATLLSGCTATLVDEHHFATVDPRSGDVVNVFRVVLEGGAGFANARYIAGYYDERAVDLFFNEVKAGDFDPAARPGAPRIFDLPDCTNLDEAACKAKREQKLGPIPVGVNAGKDGAFVMILSTDADAIAGTIGAFSETDVVVQSAMYLATKDDREKVARITASSGIVAQQRQATFKEMDALFRTSAALFEAATPQPADRKVAYLAILRAAAAGIQPNAPPAFADENEARAWFAAQPRGVQP